MLSLGGVGRTLSMLTFGIPGPAFIFFAAIELAFPLSLFWQARPRTLAPHEVVRAG